MEIQSVFLVDGEIFHSKEEAQDYIDNSADRKNIEAFANHKRANGAQRVNTGIIEEYLAFVKNLEAGEVPAAPVTSKEESVQESESTEESSDEAPWGDDSGDGEDETIRTGEEQEAKVEEPTSEPSGEVEAKPETALSGLTTTEKSKSLFARD